jgi:Protein of unknown function (DUF3667)
MPDAPASAPFAPPSSAAPAAEPGACENCGAALHGAYCHACGQSAERPTRTVRAFVAQVAADLTSLDSRLLRTLALLLARPGHLTREYLDGRRIRYTQPLQLYLGCAAAFFFVNAYHPFLSFDPRRAMVVSSLSAAGVSGTMDAASRAQLAARGVPLEVFRERFEGAATGYMPTFLVGSLLLFALVLHLMYRRPRRPYLEHAVFALHWSAFFLLLMIADRLLPRRPPQLDPVDGVFALLALAYLALALRRVYGQSWWMTGAKTLGLFVAFQALLSLWMATAIALAFTLLL